MWDSGVKVKEEAWEGVSAAAEREGLYADHEVKQELLVGPEVLQPQDVAFRLGPKFEVTVVKEELSDEELAGTGNGANSEESYSDERCQLAKDGNGKEQLLFRPCTVHLERILLDKEQHSGKNVATLKTKCPKLKENDAHIANSENIYEILSKKINICSKKGTFICDFCGLSFMLRMKIVSHLRSCSRKALKLHKLTVPLSCKICNKKFKARSNLTLHEQIHSGMKPYNCEICGKQYYQSSHLYRHKRTHASRPRKVETHTCDTCSKKYRTKYDLVIHMRVHTGQMPYVCQCCGKRFNKKSTLINHEMIHGEKRPYACGVCNKRFAVKWNLTKHQRGHTNETPYSCDVCDKRFMHSYSLTKHKRSWKHTLKSELQAGGSLKKGGLKARNK